MNDFKRTYEKSAKIVYGFLLKLCRDPALAEELTEETFYQAYLHRHQFKGKGKVDSWLCQIAKNAYLKEMKRQKRHPSLDEIADENLADHFSQIDIFHEREQTLAIFRMVHELEEPYREVFTMKVYGELTFKEIASVCQKTESWAKMTYYRAKAKIVERMEKENGYR